MEVGELAGILIFITVLVILIFLLTGAGDKMFSLTDRLRELLIFR